MEGWKGERVEWNGKKVERVDWRGKEERVEWRGEEEGKGEIETKRKWKRGMERRGKGKG